MTEFFTSIPNTLLGWLGILLALAFAVVKFFDQRNAQSEGARRPHRHLATAPQAARDDRRRGGEAQSRKRSPEECGAGKGQRVSRATAKGDAGH